MVSKSSSTFNFKRFFLTVSLTFLGCFWISFFLFISNPKRFYWRSWEYFDEILFTKNYQKKRLWEGFEKGDAVRTTLFFDQDKWQTHVTADEEGFRSVPFHAKNYPILVVGDSHTWGSGLSDHETMPWQMAQKLQIPVFNGGRSPFSLERILAKESIKECLIIVEFVAPQHILNGTIPETFEIQEYVSLPNQPLNWLSIDVRRYFFPYKLFKNFTWKHFHSTFIERKKLNDCLVKQRKYRKQQNLDEVAAKIKKRSQSICALGYTYIFVPLPSKALICADHLDLNGVSQMQEFIAHLNQEGVEAIDLTTAFAHNDLRKSLFLRTDCHIGPKGAELAASCVCNYLESKYLKTSAN